MKKLTVLSAILALSLYACGGEEPTPDDVILPDFEQGNNPIADCLLNSQNVEAYFVKNDTAQGLAKELAKIQISAPTVEPSAKIFVQFNCGFCADRLDSMTKSSDRGSFAAAIVTNCKYDAFKEHYDTATITIVVSKSTCKTNSIILPVQAS